MFGSKFCENKQWVSNIIVAVLMACYDLLILWLAKDIYEGVGINS